MKVCELNKNYNIQPVWNIAYKNSLAHYLIFRVQEAAEESQAARARLKYWGSRCSGSGEGIFFFIIISFMLRIFCETEKQHIKMQSETTFMQIEHATG